MIEDVAVSMLSSLLLGIAAAAASSPGHSDDRPESRPLDPKDYLACGVNCLYVLCRIQGIDASLEQVQQLLRPDSNGHNTFTDLNAAAGTLGLFPVAARLTPDRLATVPVPAILHVKQLRGQQAGNHFVVFLGLTEEGNPVIVDPPSPPAAHRRQSFQERWTGNVFIPCKSQSEAEELRQTFLQAVDRPWYLDPLFWTACFLTASVLLVVSSPRRLLKSL